MNFIIYSFSQAAIRGKFDTLYQTIKVRLLLTLFVNSENVKGGHNANVHLNHPILDEINHFFQKQMNPTPDADIYKQTINHK